MIEYDRCQMNPNKEINGINQYHTRESGAVLMVSLVMLLVLMVLGVSSMGTVILEEKMAGNMRDQDLAFQATEAGIRDAEARIQPLNILPIDCTVAPCNIWKRNTLSNLETNSLAWWTDPENSHEFGAEGTKDLATVVTDPRYIIEHQAYVRDSLSVGHGPGTGRDYYRITSYGVGANASAVKVLQSTSVKRFN